MRARGFARNLVTGNSLVTYIAVKVLVIYLAIVATVPWKRTDVVLVEKNDMKFLAGNSKCQRAVIRAASCWTAGHTSAT